jgi:CBS domain-containing protein
MNTAQHCETDACIRSSIGLELHVQDVMTKDVISVTKYETIVHAATILSERNISGIPVVDKNKKVIGIITQADILSIVGIRREHTLKDLLKHMLGEPLPHRRIGDLVGDIMTSSVLTMKAEANIAEVARIMDEKKIRRLPVVNEKNELIGIISRADILRAVIRKLKKDAPLVTSH